MLVGLRGRESDWAELSAPRGLQGQAQESEAQVGHRRDWSGRESTFYKQIYIFVIHRYKGYIFGILCLITIPGEGGTLGPQKITFNPQKPTKYKGGGSISYGQHCNFRGKSRSIMIF